MKTLVIVAVLATLSACAGIDTAGRIEDGLSLARGASNALLQRKTAAELELMREADGIARLLRQGADRFDRAKCHVEKWTASQSTG